MAVTFVIGRAGSGKTARCFGRAVDAMRAEPLGPPILWIVPKQATFMAERELTCAGGLGGFCRTRVLSFDQLAAEVFAECGGAAVPQVTPLGRQMILGHLLRRLQPKLGFFKSVARQAGLAAELDSTFAELERSGKSSADLSELVAELEVTDPADVDGGSLVAKLRDIRLLYDAYQAFLGQERLDPHRRLTQVLDLIAHCPLVRGSTACVDGFTDFTDNERRVLGVLAKACRDLEITLTLDPASPTVADPHVHPDDGSLFRRTEECYRRLWFTFEQAGATIEDPVVLSGAPRFRSDSLARIEGRCFSDSPAHPSAEAAASAGVELITAPDRVTEVEAIARRIRTLTREGVRYRDVGVLVRDLDDYAGVVQSTFGEHDIPYFVDRRRTAAHHPLLQFVRSVLQIASFDWPHDSTVALLKTGLACLSPDEADEVEDYVLLHRVRGGRWESAEPWTYRRDLTRPGADDADEPGADPARDRAERVDRLRRRVADHLQPLLQLARSTQPGALRSFVQALSDLFERCGVRQTVSGWMQAAADAGDLEQRAEHEQVWGELTALLAQMVELLGEEPVNAAEFTEILESGLERFDLALTPPTVDQVLVGQVDRTRTPPGLRVAFVAGLNAGRFPRGARDATVLSDTERRELRRRKVDLGDGRLDLLDERFLGYFAFTRASDRLVLTRPLAGDGDREAEPSRFWERVRELFPGVIPSTVAPVHEGSLRDAWTPRQLVVSLTNHVREGAAGDDERAAFAACYDWLSSYPASGDGVDRARKDAWPALRYVNEAALSPAVATRLFPSPLAASAAQLETFAACPFRHFLRYGLGLSEREAQGVTALDLSRVYHHVLERLIGAAIRDGVDLSDPSAPVTEETIRDHARQIGQALRGELMLSSARNEYLLNRVEKTLAEVVAAHREMMRRGQFRPSQSGLRFDAKDPTGRALPPLEVATPAGAALSVRGRIDRVDVLPAGGDAAVFDYRLGSKTLSLPQVYHGLSLQLLTSLLALGAADAPGGLKLRPAAAFYLQMARGIGEVKHPSEAPDPSDPVHLLRVKPRGVFDGSYVPALDASLAQGGRSDVVQVQIKKEGGFGNRRSSDVAEPHEFRGLLAHVRRRLGQLADGVMSGEVGVVPYRLNQESPCPQCGYRSVCRFDPAINRYRHLQPLSKEQVLEAVGQVEGAAGEE
jgi:ATP-dependent helicase/nuclease subunit B